MSRTDRIWLAVIVAAMAGIGGLNIAHQPAIEPDGIDLVTVGSSLVSGHGYPRTAEGRLDLHFPPLYPLACGALGRIAGDPELGGRLASLMCGLLLVMVVFLFARLAAGSMAARWAAALTAVAFAGLASSIASEMAYALCVTAGAGLAARGLQEGGLRWWAAAGAAFGCAYLARIEGFAYLALAPLAILLIPRAAGWTLRLSQISAFAAVFLTVSMPYLGLLHRETGTLTAGGKFVKVMISSEALAVHGPGRALSIEEVDYGISDDNRTLGLARRDEARSSNMLAYLRTHAREVAARYASNLASLVMTQIPQTFPAPLAALAGAGVVGLAGRPEGGRMLMALAWPFLAWLAFPLARVEPRFLIPHLPLVLVLAGAGVEALGAGWGRRAAAGVAAAVVLALLPGALMPVIAARWRPDKLTVAPETREVGRWLRDHGGPGTGVMARRPVIPFYAGAKFVALPHATLERTLAYARYQNTRYLVLEEDLVRAVRPQFLGLLEPGARLPGWREAYRLERRPGYRYVIFERSGRR